VADWQGFCCPEMSLAPTCASSRLPRGSLFNPWWWPGPITPDHLAPASARGMAQTQSTAQTSLLRCRRWLQVGQTPLLSVPLQATEWQLRGVSRGDVN
jgi:hypothetical protein